ncbi:MAG: AI-2E family transporter, partial [Gaiellales bacterium]
MEHDQRNRVQIEIPARTVVKVVFLIIVAYAAVRLLGQMRNVLVLLGVSLFLALMLMPLVRVVERHMRYSLAVITVWLGVVLGVLLFLGLLIAPLATQVDDLVAAAPGYIDDLQHDSRFRDLDRRYDVIKKAQQQVSQVPGRAFGAAGQVASKFADAFTVLFLTLFMMFELPRINEWVLSLLRPAQAQRVRRIGGQIQRNISGYVAGNLIISVIAGLVTFVTLEILGVPYAVALALVLALFDLVPLIGATIGAVIVVAVTLAAAGVVPALIMIAVQVAYQQLENHVLQPVVYRRTVQLSPLIILVAVLIGATLLGVLGALIA